MARPEIMVDLLLAQLKEDEAALVDFNKLEKFCRNNGARGEAILEKLNSGFRIDDEIVHELARKEMQSKHRRCVDDNKLRNLLRLKYSRTSFIIPDPFHVLYPWECVVKVSGIVSDF